MSAALSFTRRCLFDDGVALSYFKTFDTNGRGVVERLDTDLLADPPLRWLGCILTPHFECGFGASADPLTCEATNCAG